MKNLTVWLNANKISLNVKKSELVIFKHQRKKLDTDIKIKLNGKWLYPGIKIDFGIKLPLTGIALWFKLN